LNKPKNLALLLLFLAAACFLASCSPNYVDGLYFTQDNGKTLRIYRADKSEKSKSGNKLVLLGKESLFFTEAPAQARENCDLSIVLGRIAPGKESLAVQIGLYEKKQKKTVSRSYNFSLPYERNYELRIAVEAGFELSGIAFKPDNQDVSVLGIGYKKSFSGLERQDSLLKTDYTSAKNLAASSGKSIILNNKKSVTASVFAKIVDAGLLKITGQDGSGGFSARLEDGKSLYVPASLLSSSVIVEAEGGIAEAYVVDDAKPALADLHSLLWMEPGGQGRRYFRWSELPDTLVIVFDDYDYQDEYLKRLAFFAEKPGFRGRVAMDAEIAGLHGWNAHDYSPETLAGFFNKAAPGILNKSELELKELLKSNGILVQKGNTLAAGHGALISIALESTSSLRRLFMDHEASHGLYFQDADYRKLAARLWAAQSPAARDRRRIHLAWRRYDITDQGLCINEHQSYLVQQGASNTRVYLESVADRLAEAYPERAEAIMEDAELAILEAEEAIRQFNLFLKGKYGLSAGNFGKGKREK